MDRISKRIDEAQEAASLHAMIRECELTTGELGYASQSHRDVVKRPPVEHNEWQF
jgi:hypothetical protein